MSRIAPLSEDILSEKLRTLERVLLDLSESFVDSDEGLEKYATKLSEIYSNGYRQLYSDLYPILSQISDGDADRLISITTNLSCLYRYVGRSEEWRIKNPELFGHLLKLSDHINIEMQRMVESFRLKENLERLQNETSSLFDRAEKLESKHKKAMKKIKSLQMETVSILAIFAAIVVAFSGGMNILGNAIAGIGDIDTYSLAFIVSLCGIVLFNTVVFLLHCVMYIVSRLHDDNDKVSLLLDWKYILGFNAMMISIMVATIILQVCL